MFFGDIFLFKLTSGNQLGTLTWCFLTHREVPTPALGTTALSCIFSQLRFTCPQLLWSQSKHVQMVQKKKKKGLKTWECFQKMKPQDGATSQTFYQLFCKNIILVDLFTFHLVSCSIPSQHLPLLAKVFIGKQKMTGEKKKRKLKFKNKKDAFCSLSSMNIKNVVWTWYYYWFVTKTQIGLNSIY